jgi:tetratricopeptide (TPR) repeat protein
MLKALRTGLKELFRPVPAKGREVVAAARGVQASPWFEDMRRALAAREGSAAEAIAAQLAREPANAEVHALAGELRLAEGAPAAALACLARALELRPDFAPAHNAMGEALRALARNEEALASFRRAVELAHDLVAAHLNMGRSCEDLGRDEEAADCYALALAFDGGAVEAGLGLGRTLRKQGRLAESVAQLKQTLEHAPRCAPACLELGRTLNQAGDTAGAIAFYERALELRRDCAEACANLGLIHLLQLGDAARAEALFRRAAEISPDLVEVQANLGLAIQEQGRFEEALAHYEVQIARRPDFVELRWNRGIANLAQGRFAAGWDDYELRKMRPDAGGVHQKFTLPDWDGSPLRARSILVYGEQGLGDEIMFASCLPDAIAQAGSCVIECDTRLEALYRRSFPRARIEARGRALCRELDFQSAVGSLPRYLRRSEADFPQHAGYLVADPGATARWGKRLDALGPLPKVGVAWRGGKLRTRGSLRSLALEQAAPLLDYGQATFVVLQRGLSEGERAALQNRSTVWVPDYPESVDDLAALVCALDLVVSVDNTLVHLAGALGRPVWVLVSYSPDWRYRWQGEQMLWYPSARLLRQPRPGDWRSVIGETRRLAACRTYVPTGC